MKRNIGIIIIIAGIILCLICFANWNKFRGDSTLILAISGIIGGTFTLFTYWENTRLRRAEWLSSLYEKFFIESYYTKIRRLLDNSPEKTPNIEKQIKAEEEEDFVNYLNFFQYIAYLEKHHHLAMEEINDMFRYYISHLDDHCFVKQYLRDNGFDLLCGLITKTKNCKGGI